MNDEQIAQIQASHPGHTKIDWFDTLTITAFVTAFVGDILSLLVLPHYLAGSIVLALIWPRSRGFLAKFLLVLAFLIPFPGLLTAGVFFAILFTNSKLLAWITSQGLVAGFTILTGGAGVVTEGAVVGAEAGEAGVAVAEGGSVALPGVEGAGALTAGSGVAEGSITEGAFETAEGGEAMEASETATEANESRSLGDKIKDEATERFKNKLQSENGDRRDEDSDEDAQRTQELNEALGEPKEPIEELGGQLLENIPAGYRQPSDEFVAENVPPPASHGSRPAITPNIAGSPTGGSVDEHLESPTTIPSSDGSENVVSINASTRHRGIRGHHDNLVPISTIEQPVNDSVSSDKKNEKELNKALGEVQSPMEKLHDELLESISAPHSTPSISPKDNPGSSTITPGDRGNYAGRGGTTADIKPGSDKTTDLRSSKDDSSPEKDLPRAA